MYWGFTYADTPDVGVGVFVLTNSDQKLADAIADDMQDYIWQRRAEFESDIPGVEEGVSQAIAENRLGKRPVLLADMSDRMGDSTHILHELMARGAHRVGVASIADLEAVDRIHAEYKVGDPIHLEVGGRSSPLAGDPFAVSGVVHHIGHFQINDVTPSPYAVIRFGEPQDSFLFLSPTYHQVSTPEIFHHAEVPLESLNFIIVKSRRHYRRGFVETGLVEVDIIIDAPGHGPADISKLPFRNAPEGMYSRYFEKQVRN